MTCLADPSDGTRQIRYMYSVLVGAVMNQF